MSPYRRGLPLPDGHFAAVTAETVLVAGGKSPAYLRQAPAAIAAQISGATTVVLEGQTHEVKASVLAPVLVGHFVGREPFRAGEVADLRDTRADEET